MGESCVAVHGEPSPGDARTGRIIPCDERMTKGLPSRFGWPGAVTDPVMELQPIVDTVPASKTCGDTLLHLSLFIADV
jgi:hypothetical protein